MLKAMARITPPQPNDAMARIASRRNRTISLDPNLPGQNFRESFFDVDSKLFSEVQIDSKEDWARIRGKITGTTTTNRTHNFTFGLAEISPTLPVVRRLLK
jgi:hypothetical protein